MFQKKPIYIILLIVFTLLLCADVLAYALTANALSNLPSMPSSIPSGEAEEGGFGANMPQRPGDNGQSGAGNGNFRPSASALPETGDSGGASGAAGGGSAASDGSLPATTDGGDSSGAQNGSFDRSQVQGDASNRPDSLGTRSVFGFASFISGWWIPIGALCVIMDAFCVFMLIRLSKKAVPALEPAAEEPAAQGKVIERKPALSSYEKRRRKRRRTMRIVAVILAILAAIVLGYAIVRSVYLAQLAEEDAAKVVSAKAAGATINTVISGTGTLADEDAVEITVPNEVEIRAYHVENGDAVKAGDILATVDHTSVMKAIEDLHCAMDALDEDIEAASGDAIESAIKASVDGRVKAIYAREGTAVADTMYDDGALMLLSLDGLMAADIETNADLTTGDSVVVLLADGTKKAGRVASVSEGTATVTLTDNGTVYGENVTVTDEEGNTLGTAPLYIHSELKVTGYSGTVATIKRSENELVGLGETLLTLTDTAYTAQYKLLLETRSKYEEEMIKLFKLYQDGNLYAEFAGIVSGVDEENSTAATSNTASSGETSSDALASTAAASNALSSNASALNALASNMLPLKALTTQPAYSFAFLGTDPSATVALGNNPSGADDAMVQAYSNFAASVSSVSYNSIALMEYATSLAITDYSNFAALGVTSDMMTAQTKISPPANTPVYMFENGAWASLSVSDIAAGDVLILTYGPSGAAGDPVWIIVAGRSEQGQGGGTSSYSGLGGSHSASADTQAEAQPEELYTVSDTTALSVTPSETMSVTITIDELDILSMKVGQEATITLDAISGQTFTGSVSEINTTGTNSGGSTKFTAVIALGRTEQMLAGMNAAVSITLSSTDCAATLPVAALMESESGVFVYTSYDQDKGQFGDPVNVTTGLSDGASVEILSGISSGADVWYAYNDTVNITSSVVSSANGGGFNLMRIFRGR
ncbi:MAG: HlyD family efflux transporter periplasmic adaptor subunit [Bacillota bacterium]